MKQKINLRLIGIAVIAVLATAIGITFKIGRAHV